MPRAPAPTESEANVPQNVRNIFDETGEWAHSSFDHRHQLVASGAYELPAVRGAGAARAAAVRLARQRDLIAQSGAPFTVNLGVDQANIGAGPAQRPDQLRDPESAGRRAHARAVVRHLGLRAAGALHLRQRAAQQRDRSRLRQPRPGGGEDAGVCGARSQLEFRWEVFNALNRANFDMPNRIFGTPNFGRIFSAKLPREMQLGLRLAF